ncbi:hypothetical protein CO614_08505 [Lysobacteraceae bacterium NML120232]|nr:hypothetical protein CO608_05195 [Xanthomonadaceae bacterium NML08-0793]PJK10819.1 hypothetical protein CO614_08505 [Xanthomonadaceae bacterium NML120232]
MERPTTSLQHADRIGFVAAMLCAVHCATLPLLLALLPTFAMGVQGWVDLDQAIVVLATLLALTTLFIGWRRHRIYRAWQWLLPALGLLWFASFGPFHGHEGWELWLHTGLMVAGGVLLAVAHMTNIRLTHRAAGEG